MKRLGATTAVALGVLFSAGCNTQSATELVASARSFMDKGEANSAVIQLKAALQLEPQSAETRFLLGRALLDNRDGVAAAVELQKALDLGYSEQEVLPLLARAMVGTNQAKRFTDLHGRTRLSEPRAHAELRAWVATGYAQQGLAERAEASMNTALQLDPSNLVARTLLARFTAGRGEADKALELVNAILQEDDKRLDVWQLKGDLLAFAKQDKQAAAEAYLKAVDIEPRFQSAHVALIGLALEAQDLETFKLRLANMKKALPRSAETRFYEAQAALLDRQLPQAREITQSLLKIAPDNYRVLQLSGAIELNDSALVLAENSLNKAIQLVPELVVARRLLAQTYLRSGQPARALSTLKPLVEGPQPDAQAMALTAEAYLQNGQFELSERYFQAAAKLSPDDTKIRTALALTQIAKGRAEEGFSQLEALAKADASTYADLATISVRLRRKELPQALDAISKLEPKMPDAALPHHLRGRVLAQQGQQDAARASFEQALVKDPVYFPALATLAAMDVAAKQPERAQKRLEDHLAREPRSVQALLALADLRQRAGASTEEVRKLLTDAVAANPGEAAPRLLLINFLLTQKQAAAALTAAQEAVSRLPQDPGLQDALGRSHLAKGEIQQALAAFGKVAAAQPESIGALMRLADAQLQNKDVPAATRSLNKALELDPRSLLVQGALMQVALRDKRPADALAIARAVQKQRPQAAVGYLMETDIYTDGNQLPQAIKALDTALRLEPATSTATRLHALLTLDQRSAEAARLAQSWLQRHPRDASFIFHLGSMAMDGKRLDEAESRYRQVVELRPEDPTALNNLAWVLAQQGKPGALPLAQKANTLAPDQPPLMDTMATVLAAEGQLDQALVWQRKVVAQSPNVPNYRLRLAELLIKSGDKAGARTELEELVKLGDRYARQGEVAQLLKTL